MGMCVNAKGRGVALKPQATLAWAALVALLLGASGCASTVDDLARTYDSKLPFDTPIDWWHQLQGGAIADERPPPPGIGDPYPNLGTIPARPTPPDAAARRTLSARLSAERDRSNRLAGQDPIPSVPPVPAKGAPKAAPETVPETAPPMASIEAAQARPAPRAPAAAAAPPAPAAIQAAASPTPPPRSPPATSAAPPVSGPAPALPTAPPPLPSIDGIPAATRAPAVPKAQPQVDAAFVQNSAVLRPESDAALRQLAARRFGGVVALLGGGDAPSALPDAQAAALPLAWKRARAMADVLVAAGVPVSAMRIDAAALARGGIARLID